MEVVLWAIIIAFFGWSIAWLCWENTKFMNFTKRDYILLAIMKYFCVKLFLMQSHQKYLVNDNLFYMTGNIRNGN